MACIYENNELIKLLASESSDYTINRVCAKIFADPIIFGKIIHL